MLPDISDERLEGLEIELVIPCFRLQGIEQSKAVAKTRPPRFGEVVKLPALSELGLRRRYGRPVPSLIVWPPLERKSLSLPGTRAARRPWLPRNRNLRCTDSRTELLWLDDFQAEPQAPKRR